MADMLRERLAKFIPPREEWSPVDEALYGVKDIYNVPEEKAKKLRENAIRYSFKYHYEKNYFYHAYCKEMGVKPDDMKTEEDFNKIPLVPDTFFKSYPDIEEDGGKNFLKWLEKIYTGELPKIAIEKNTTISKMQSKLNKKGIKLCHTSGTSKKISILPHTNESIGHYVHTYTCALSEMLSYKDKIKMICFSSRMPMDIAIGNVFKMAENTGVWNMLYLLENLGIDLSIMKKRTDEKKKKMLESSLKKLEKMGEDEDYLFFLPPPFLPPILKIMDVHGLKFNFRNANALTGGGGWIMTQESYRDALFEYFGISQDRHIDLYTTTELDVCVSQCKGHYYHLPPSVLYPFVLDEEMNPLPCGEYGRFSFLDSLANSYPGFIITGDRVKLLEHCPECDRPGPVLAPEISRVPGVESRGCAEVMAKVLEEMRE